MIEQHEIHNSQSVRWIAFNPETGTIMVRFKTGATYAYEGTRAIWEDFVKADSKGGFIHHGLKGLPYKKIAD